MKKCSWCGLEYPDTTTMCPTDGTPLSEPETPPAPAAMVSVPPEVPTTVALTPPALSERRLRLLEVVLVCVIAFGGSLLASTFMFLGLDSGGSGGWVLRWAHSMLHAASCLGLLWYIMARRSKSLRDLGLSCNIGDFGWSIALYLAGYFGYMAMFETLRFSNLAPTSIATAGDHVAKRLFPAGVSLMAFTYQFINPFFEEIIARGYLMKEVLEMTSSAWVAVVLSTFLQTSYHFYQGGPMALSEGAIFLIFSIYYARTRRLTPLILAHLYMDVGSTLLYALRHS